MGKEQVFLYAQIAKRLFFPKNFDWNNFILEMYSGFKPRGT